MSHLISKKPFYSHLLRDPLPSPPYCSFFYFSSKKPVAPQQLSASAARRSSSPIEVNFSCIEEIQRFPSSLHSELGFIGISLKTV